MRILFLCNPWAVTREPARLVGVHPDLRDGRHRWFRAIGGPGALATDISYDMRRDSVRAIAERCPGGYPDVMVVWAPGYQALPAGVEDAPFPVIACYSDWPLLMPDQCGMLDAYDYIFACRGGVRTMNQMGYQNVEYWPMYGHDPLLSRVIPGIEKQWDIGLIGNLSSVVQRERAPWLARVARLSDRFRVRIAGGVFNEEYTRLMNATKITFNRTFRITLNNAFDGAMNMRCYEAAACGSLLFCEEENEEIREFLEDRVHCVLYNDDNLEELLEHYLTHDEEREQICTAAVERISQHSFPRNLLRLADRLEELDLPSRMKERRIRSLPAPERLKRHARQVVGAMTLGSKEAALQMLDTALSDLPDDSAALNDQAVVKAQLVGQASHRSRAAELTAQALQLMGHATELCPASGFYRVNLAHMLADVGRREAALELLQQTLPLLAADVEDPADPFCLPFPFTWDEFRVQASILYCATRSAPELYGPLRRCLMLYRGAMLLGHLAEEAGLDELAALGYRVATAARADLGSSRIGLARLLAAAGQTDEALAQLDTGLETDPFLTEGWMLAARLLREQGREADLEQFARDRLTILEALAPSAERLAMSDALTDLEKVRLALSQMLTERGAAAECPLRGAA